MIDFTKLGMHVINIRAGTKKMYNYYIKKVKLRRKIPFKIVSEERTTSE